MEEEITNLQETETSFIFFLAGIKYKLKIEVVILFLLILRYPTNPLDSLFKPNFRLNLSWSILKVSDCKNDVLDASSILLLKLSIFQ